MAAALTLRPDRGQVVVFDPGPGWHYRPAEATVIAVLAQRRCLIGWSNGATLIVPDTMLRPTA